MAELTLDVNSVSKNYKGNSKPAVNKVSLGIVPGEIMGILGPTGAGKSTLLRLMGGLAMPDSGDILLSGVSLYHDYEGCMSKIGYVPDRPELYSYMTGRKNLRVFAEMYGGTALSKIGDIISMLMLEDYIDLPVSTYPQGIKQLLAIGAALLNSPILLIIDEAMNGLDPLAIINLKERLLDLSESYGMSVVMTTHHLREIEGLCHRVAIMDKGGISGLSTPKYLREQNSTHLGYRILLDRPDEAGAEIKRMFDCGVSVNKDYIKVNVDQSKISSVLQILVKNGYFVYEAEELKTTFEEAYLKMIKDCMKKKGRVRQ